MNLYLRIKKNIWKGSKGQRAHSCHNLVWMPGSKYQQDMLSSTGSPLKGAIKSFNDFKQPTDPRSINHQEWTYRFIAKSKENATTKNRGVCSFTHIPGCFLEELGLLPWLRQLTPSNQKYYFGQAWVLWFISGLANIQRGKDTPRAKNRQTLLLWLSASCSGNSSHNSLQNAQVALWGALLYLGVSPQ